MRWCKWCGGTLVPLPGTSPEEWQMVEFCSYGCTDDYACDAWRERRRFGNSGVGKPG